ncbi:MAG: hypothetical protein D3914_01240 [Candidatus Electrothrix sp. LOE2]|nr:hypothetical protein [Candidatus Electrothrix sp. LOE2]
MKTSIQSIALKEGGQLLIEVEDIELPGTVTGNESIPNLPPGAEEIGFNDKVRDITDLLRQNLSGIFETVAESVKTKHPDEWGVEVNIGFKGKTNPVPVILSGEANAAIKVHAKWTKDKSEAQNG